MADPIVQQLDTLKPDSEQRLPTSILYGFATAKGGQWHLIKKVPISASEIQVVPKGGRQGMLRHRATQHKVFTLDHGKHHFMHTLNKELMGGASYPVLTAILGTLTGMASGGAGLLFSAAGVGLDLKKRSTNVLARIGDEIWHIEEFGKVREKNYLSADDYVPVYVSSFWLADPFRFRGPCNVKGWLLHEDRSPVHLA